MFSSLSTNELENIKKWKYKVDCPGFFSNLLNPFYNQFAHFLLNNCSPWLSANMISSFGFLASIFAFFSSSWNSIYSNYFTAFSITLYMIMDDIDGKFARLSKTSSPLGEIVDHFFDCFTNTLLTVSICNVFNIPEEIRHYLILFTSIGFLLEHLRAYYDFSKTIRFSKFTGPTELLVYTIFAIIFKNQIIPYTNWIFDTFNIFYIKMMSIIAIGVLLDRIVSIISKHSNFQNDIFLLVSIVMSITITDNSHYINTGFTFSLLTSEFILAKMSNSHCHLSSYLLPIQTISFLFPGLKSSLVIIHLVSTTIQIANHLNLPLIQKPIRIFISGYYDGLHQGHLNSIEQAAKIGNILIVGVHSDADSLTFKNKKPVFNDNERIAEIEKLSIVNEVVPYCQQIFDSQFLLNHQIDYIAMSDEYLYPDNSVHESYKTAWTQNKIKIIHRTPNISSTQLRDSLIQKRLQVQ